MSMMELLSQMRERARIKKQRKGSLPWFCILRSDKCIEPDKPCTECRVYQKHKDELEKEMKQYDNQSDSASRERGESSNDYRQDRKV